MKKLHFLVVLLVSGTTIAQVGINTTTPKATLDIVASDATNPSATDGLLIPRVENFPATNPGADQNGMLIFLTTTVGANTPGIYSWNNASSSWEKISGTATGDADFYEVGTTASPDDISDDIFTLGNVAIGKNTADNPLDIVASGTRGASILMDGTDNNIKVGVRSEVSNTGTGSHYAIYNSLSGSGVGTKKGIENYFSGAVNGNLIGVENTMVLSNGSNSNKSGIRNVISSNGNGDHVGTRNILGSSGTGNQYGSETSVSGIGTGDFYGQRTVIAGGGLNKYGSFIDIDETSAGIHYGLYSQALKANSYAGYFLGRLSVGTTITDNYIFPSSRGVNGQVMQTDGSGNLSWVDASSFAGDADFFTSGTTDSPTSINDQIYTNGAMGINSNPLTATLEVISNDKFNGINLEKTVTNPINSIPNAIRTRFIGTHNTISSHITGIRLNTIVDNPTGTAKFTTGIYNGVSVTNNTAYGIHNYMNTNGTTSGGINVGVQSTITGTGQAFQYGFRGMLSSEINSLKTGSHIEVSNGTGSKYGAFYGLYGAGASQEIGNFVSILNGADAPIQTAFRTQIGSNVTNVRKGLDVDIYNGTGGTQYGTYITLRNGAFGNNASLYGSYVTIPSTTTSNVQYGMYSDVRKATGYAGYFLGRVAIGSSSGTNYIMPLSRGTNGQIMQTDGSGNVTWADLPLSTSFWNRTGTILNLANAGDDIEFTSNQTSITFPATGTGSDSMFHLFRSGTANSDRMIFSQSPTFSNWGLMYRDFDDSFRFLSSGNDRVVISLQGPTPLIVNGTAQATDFQSATTTYPDYVFESYFEGASAINPEYSFRTLDEIFDFIKANGHLPGVKSFEEVKSDGMQVNLTETAIKNLEKIEELYLYAYELQQKNKQLIEDQKKLEERLERLEKLLLKQ